MKNLILFVAVGLLLVLQSCYDDYKFDYDYSSTYFPRQFPLRTMVQEDGKELAFDAGVVLAGKYSNDKNEVVQFQINSTLLDEYPDLELLPSSYYSFSDENEITIPAGEFKGAVKVTFDKDAFMADPLSVGNNYALPLEIVSSSTDSILSEKNYCIYVVRYFNKYHGWYWLKGADYTLDASGNVADEFVYSKSDLVDNDDMLLETIAVDSLKVPYVGMNVTNNEFSMKMKIGDDGACAIVGDSNSTISSVVGAGRYDGQKITLDYKYVDAGGFMHQVYDTLYFRNVELKLEDWQ